MPNARRIGRPYVVTEQVANTIVHRVESGRTLLSVAKDPDLPSVDAIWDHMRRDETFREAVARARKESAHGLAMQVVEIADADYDPALVHVMRNRCDQRKWLAAKYNLQYSEKTTTAITGADGGPIAVEVDDRRKNASLVIDAAFGVIEEAPALPAPHDVKDT